MILEAKNIVFSYEKKEIINNINFSFDKGDIISLLGPNGSGKTTFLKILLGFLKFKGEVFLYGKEIRAYNKKELARYISYLPQTHTIPFSYSVMDIVLMGRLAHIGFFSNYSKKDKDFALESLERINILHLKNESYANISGGERQLCFLARALTQGSKIFFMDEPVSGLDFGNQIKFLKMLKSLSKDGYSFLKSTHFPEHALYVSNKVALLKNGHLIAYGKNNDVMNEANMSLLYGVGVNFFYHENGYISCVPKI